MRKRIQMWAWQSMLLYWVLLAVGTHAVQAQTVPLPAASKTGEAHQVGVITLADGDARVAPASGPARAAKVGDVVSEGDLLMTSKDGELHIQMQDSGFMALRANSQMKVISYKADGGDDDRGVFRLLTGGLRSITGWIGRFNASAYQVRTATATVGIRGTDHEVRYIPEGSSEGEPGTYDRVFAGETSIETPGGKTQVTPNQAGFVSGKPQAKPRLLADIPGFFRPGPHEADINKKHAEIQKQIEQRRQERQQRIAEKRQAFDAARAQVQEEAAKNKAAAQAAARQAQLDQAAAQEQREALQKEGLNIKERYAQLKAQREELEAVVKTGQITLPELRQRRKALMDESKSLEQAFADHQSKRKAFQESQDAKLDERFQAGQERSRTLYNSSLEAREKRKDLDAERESARDELTMLQRQESQRYQQERQADRKQGAVSSPAAE